MVVEEVKRCMDILDIHDRMPTYAELDTVSTVPTGIKKFGSKTIADEIGVPCINRRYIKKKEKPEPEIAPSNAFEIEKEARKTGRSYADIQKAETERMSGKINLKAYEGMKPWSERISEDEVSVL